MTDKEFYKIASIVFGILYAIQMLVAAFLYHVRKENITVFDALLIINSLVMWVYYSLKIDKLK